MEKIAIEIAGKPDEPAFEKGVEVSRQKTNPLYSGKISGVALADLISDNMELIQGDDFLKRTLECILDRANFSDEAYSFLYEGWGLSKRQYRDLHSELRSLSDAEQSSEAEYNLTTQNSPEWRET